MEYINLKYKGNHARRSQPISMGGFMLEAPVKFEDGKEIIRRGRLGLQFKLLIPPDGTCRVPDTEHNRAILRVHCFPRVDKMQKPKMEKGRPVLDDEGFSIGVPYDKKQPATYELISKIDLNEDAPDKPDKTYTQAELEAIVAQKVIELRDAKPLTDVEKVAAEDDLKAKKQAAKDEEERIAAEDAEEEARLKALDNESPEAKASRIKAERFANKIG